MKRMALIVLMLITGLHGFLPPPLAWAESERDQVQEGLLVNSGFEATEAGSSWSGGIKPANWGQWLPTGSPILGVDSGIFKSGKQSVSIEGPAGTGSHNPVHPGRGRENVSDQRLGQNGIRQQCRAHPISNEANRHQQCAGSCRNAQGHPRLDVYGEAVHRSA